MFLIIASVVSTYPTSQKKKVIPPLPFFGRSAGRRSAYVNPVLRSRSSPSSVACHTIARVYIIIVEPVTLKPNPFGQTNRVRSYNLASFVLKPRNVPIVASIRENQSVPRVMNYNQLIHKMSDFSVIGTHRIYCCKYARSDRNGLGVIFEKSARTLAEQPVSKSERVDKARRLAHANCLTAETTESRTTNTRQRPSCLEFATHHAQ